RRVGMAAGLLRWWEEACSPGGVGGPPSATRVGCRRPSVMSDPSVDPAQVASQPARPGVLLRLWTHRLVFWIGLAVIAGTAAHYRFIESATTEDVLHVALLAAVLFVEIFMLGRMSREKLEREAESQLRSRVMIDLDNFRIALSRAY